MICTDWQIVTAIAAVVALIISILTVAISTAQESCMRFIDNFDKLYYKTFSLRKKLTSLVEETENEEFFYEIDRIIHSEEIQNEVLDYLTEMENFFFLVIGHQSVYRSFEKLMSFALYQRLSIFYGFILRKRAETNNQRLFLNYEKALMQIRRMKKVKKQLTTHNNKKRCYIGIRSSDCIYSGGYFQSDISIFSDDVTSKIFPIRPNQNKTNKNIIPYIVKQIGQLIAEYPSYRFVFYNGMMAYNMPAELYPFFLCLNPENILSLLNNKPSLKLWLTKHAIPVLPYETFLGQEITQDALEQRFQNSDQFVIQSSNGGGGIGTFLVSSQNFNQVVSLLQPLRQYIVSAYVKYGVSVNTHIFISDKQTVLSPGSIQIIEIKQNQLCYRGADFFAFRALPVNVKERIRSLSFCIANQLRQLGYRGIAGLDFLVTKDEEVYCMEVNPRFQASSVPLDMYLQGNKGKAKVADSTFALNEQAFSNQMVTTLCFDDQIEYSCYYYYKEDIPLEFFKAKRSQLQKNGVIIHDDGFLSFSDERLLNSDSYLFRAVFPHPICNISPDMTLMLNDNIPVHDLPKDVMDLKIALLNQGIVIDNPPINIKKGTYESVDITFSGEKYCKTPVPMNCGYNINLSQYSPFMVSTGKHNNILTYYNIPLGESSIEMDRLDGMNQIDKRILYLATDRLRIKLVAGCEYKNIGRGCRFCNLPMSDKRFTLQEIEASLLRLKAKDISFRHILIGGGTCLSPDIWEDIILLCKFLKSDDFFRDNPISLMSVLPPKEKLSEFLNAGLTEVAFNIEVANDILAKKLMPGKRSQSKAAYYSVLEEAVHVFGIGAVRSALLVGLDEESSLLNEVKNLAQMGVIPCLSAFRALPGCDFANSIQPDNATLRRIYDICSEMLATMNGPIHELGPTCRDCRNNMLAI